MKPGKRGIILIIDEITAGFRLNMGGAHLRYNLEPDIAVFGKAMSNGYPMAAIIGKRFVMEAAQNSFISSLFWTEKIGPVASITTIEIMQDPKIFQTIKSNGEKISNGLKKAADETNIELSITGNPAILGFSIQHQNPLVVKTYFIQELLKKEFISTFAYYSSISHTDAIINNYLGEVKSVFKKIKENFDILEKLLEGAVCHAGFKRLT